jgi:alkanesulfonate monooxygenase SsuD/methylene tetrahydromethanopterin reductase-like flavin-dependent oxidoreductase (luciferase family)
MTPNIKFGLDVPIDGEFADPHLLTSLALEAEQCGWHGFFVQDAIASDKPLVDPWISLSAIAVDTKDLRIGAFLTALPRRRPWKVARETVTLDALSNGRLIFAAGLGFNPADFSNYGEDSSLQLRADMLDEGLHLLDRFWSGEKVTFDGAHYQVADVTMLPRPIQRPRIPIWLGGGWPVRAPFKRAARWDGIYVMTEKATGGKMTPDDIREMRLFIAGHRGEWDDFEIAFADKTPIHSSDLGQLVWPFAEAGVTWWLEGLWSMSPMEARKRLECGPPQI